jgi:hypothetical protein
MARPSYQLREMSHSESVQWLRQRLGKPAPPPPPPRQRSVLGPRVPIHELVEHMTVAVFVDRGAYLGRVATIRARQVVLFAWGVPRPMVFENREIRFVQVVAEHTWEAEREIAGRQRAGVAGLERQGSNHRGRAACRRQ